MINFKDIVIDTIYDLDINLNKEEIKELIEIPPNPEMGDFSFPCFKLSKTLRKKAKNDIIQEDIDNLKKELEKLNELYKNGVLTQIEYNQKQEKYEQKITELKKNIS